LQYFPYEDVAFGNNFNPEGETMDTIAQSEGGVNNNWKLYVGISLSGMILIILLAIITELWVLTAIPIGFLFGFFLQKGSLCGASAFSEVILFKDRTKVWGLWIAIVTGMVGFAILDLAGLIVLNPKPLIWGSYIVGGLIFGVGMVLAGGCVSGCLFKAGAGNLASIMAILGIALGVALVEYGPLYPFYTGLKSFVIKSADGGSVTLASLTGLPFWAIALIILILTIFYAFWSNRGKTTKDSSFSIKDKILAKSWKPWQAGLLIGLLGSAAYLSSDISGRNYPLGVTHGVLHVQLLMTEQNLNHIYQKKVVKTEKTTESNAGINKKDSSPATVASVAPHKKVSWWLILLVSSLILGSWIAGRLSGESRLRAKPPQEVLIALIGGLLVGTGAALARGCVIGNIMSGWALMSIGTVLFGIIVIIANWITTYFYLMGSNLRK
jgi:uncharacterized membrane protein YedE/YeeE